MDDVVAQVHVEQLLGQVGTGDLLRRAAAEMPADERHKLLTELRSARTNLALVVGRLDGLIAQLDDMVPAGEPVVDTSGLFVKWNEVLRNGGEYPRPVEIVTPAGYVEANALEAGEILFNHGTYAIHAWHQGMWRFVSVGYLHRLAEALGVRWQPEDFE